MISLSKRNTKHTFPFPKLNGLILILLDSAIKSAWSTILSKPQIQLNSLIEEKITEKLQKELQRTLDYEKVTGFNRSIFQNIHRGAKFCSYNDEHLEKQPDLLIQQIQLRPGINDSRHDALFIECKILDDLQKSPRLYIEDGIRRFVDGEYAWAMPQAMMIAYIKGNHQLPESLKTSFLRNFKKINVAKCSPINNEYHLLENSIEPKINVTSHERTWEHAKHGKPGQIDLMHIWLDCNQP
jgi:hypothetical protein